ncbi:MAG: tetratricopeptide repeat protein, partial [Pseudomonadota bacterium]
KHTLVNPRERIQWVAGYPFPWARYPELQVPFWQALAKQLRAGDQAGALEMLRRQIPDDPLTPLLEVEIRLTGGDLDGARQHLKTLSNSSDVRAAALRAEILMRLDDLPTARAVLERAPANVDTLTARGDLERLEGHGEAAATAYTAATEQAPQDFRGWLGRGQVATEREDLAPARGWLEEALKNAPDEPLVQAERAALETLANRLGTAREDYQRLLQSNPDDYVALTGRGVLELKAGHPAVALASFLKATAIEPLYARPVLYTAVAYYQMGRDQAALDTLARAARLDPQDPLPYFYETLIRRDQLEPAAAIRAAREAQLRLPYLKSLNQLANDRQGSANLGSSYALFGLEDWARREAQQSFLPFWAGSYLFLADRINETHPKNSALVQGFLTDPTVFGASPKRQSLMSQPNTSLTLGLRANETKAFHSLEPTFTASGYAVTPFPIAGFAEAIDTEIQPKSERLEASAPTGTLALGLRPSPELGLFVYGNRFQPFVSRLDDPQPTGVPQLSRLDGTVSRLDLGASYRFSPEAQLWLKQGSGEEDSILRHLNESETRHWQRTEQDNALRTSARRGSLEWTVGGEMGTRDVRADTDAIGKNRNHNELRADTEERTRRTYLSLKWEPSSAWLWQTDLDYGWLRATQRNQDQTTLPNGTNYPLPTYDQDQRFSAWTPRVGVAYSPTPGQTYRLAVQRYLRPVSDASLAPLDTAGILLDVPGLLPG